MSTQEPVTLEELRRHYDEQYTTAGLRDSDSYYRWILNLLEVRGPARLLDVSCGEGHLLRWARGRGVSVVGLDISSEAARLSQEAMPGVPVLVGNGERLPYPDSSFEYVTCLGSLEHFWHPGQGVSEIARVLTKDGRACLLLPNAYWALDLYFRVARTGYGPHHNQIMERFAAKNEWRDLIQTNGLSVYRIVKYNAAFPRSRADLRWFLRRSGRLLSLLTAPLTPLNFAYSFAFLCQLPT